MLGQQTFNPAYGLDTARTNAYATPGDISLLGSLRTVYVS